MHRHTNMVTDTQAKTQNQRHVHMLTYINNIFFIVTCIPAKSNTSMYSHRYTHCYRHTHAHRHIYMQT